MNGAGRRRAAQALMALALVASPLAAVQASWKLVSHAAPVKVAKGGMTVTAGEDWNRFTGRAIPKGETWSLDGPSLNTLYFVADLAPGETLLKDAAKKDRPLPTFADKAQLTDIADFVESSIRVSLNTSDYQTTTVEPIKFLGADGVRFAFQYAVTGNPLPYQGLAEAALINGHLYAILYAAPKLYYFDRDQAKVRAIMDSAKL